MSGEAPGGAPPLTAFRGLEYSPGVYKRSEDPSTGLREVALRLHGWGYNVLPVRDKKPLVERWKLWQDTRQGVGDLEELPWDSASGVAVVMGGPEINLVCVDVDDDPETPLEIKRLWVKGLAEVFGLRCQRTRRGLHYYAIVDEALSSTEITGLLEVKARGCYVVVAGPGYESVDLDPNGLSKISSDKFVRALEVLRRLWALRLPRELIEELRREGQRSEADMRLFLRLLREGWGEEDIYTAWVLLSDRFFAEVRERKHQHPRDYFELTIEKARKWISEHGLQDDIFTSRPLMRVVESAEPVRWRIQGLIPESGLGVLAGRPGVTKSIQALLLAHALSSGHRAWDALDVAWRSRVLIIDGENPESVFRDRVAMFKLNPLNDIELSKPRNLDLNNERHLQLLKEKIVQGGFGVVVIDPFRAFLGVDENDNAAISKILYGLKEIAEETKSFILLIHHTRKQGEVVGDPQDEIRGSSAIVAAADLVLLLKGEGSVKVLRTVKNRLGPPIALEISIEEAEGGGVTAKARQIRLEDAFSETEKCVRAILKYMESAGRAERKNIVMSVPYSRRTIDRVLAKLVADGFLVKEGRGVYAYPSSTLDVA